MRQASYYIPLAIAAALLAKGVVQLLTIPLAGYDVRLLWTATHYYLRGANPFDASSYFDDLRKGIAHATIPTYFQDLGWPEQVNYPPTSTLTQMLIFGLPLRATWYWYLVLNVVGFGIVGWWAAATIEGPRRTKVLVAGVALANLGYSQTIINGNYGIVVMAALVLAVVWRDRHPRAAGLLLAIALVKPTISLPFVLLFAAGRRYALLTTCALYLLASTVLTMGVTGEGLVTLLRQTLEGSARFATGGYAVWKVMRALGMGQTLALTFNALVFLVPLALVVWRASDRGDVFHASVLACAALAARLFTYHNSIDNVLVTFLAVALVKCAFTRRDMPAGVLTMLVAMSVLVPFVWTNSVTGHVVLYFVWLGAAGYLVSVSMFGSSSQAAVNPTAVLGRGQLA